MMIFIPECDYYLNKQCGILTDNILPNTTDILLDSDTAAKNVLDVIFNNNMLLTDSYNLKLKERKLNNLTSKYIKKSIQVVNPNKYQLLYFDSTGDIDFLDNNIYGDYINNILHVKNNLPINNSLIPGDILQEILYNISKFIVNSNDPTSYILNNISQLDTWTNNNILKTFSIYLYRYHLNNIIHHLKNININVYSQVF